MSHELRTPLNAMLGYAELLQEDAQDEGDKALVTDLERIRTAGKHLLTLINDVLDLSRIEAGKLALSLERVAIDDVVIVVTTTMQPLIEKNGNTLLVKCAADVCEMWSDATRVRQILLILLSNAAKFTTHGTISLEVAHEQINNEPWVTFVVRDTGIGMTPDQVSKLFQPFTQVDASLTRKYGGTGLGLVLCRRFCDLLGGTISVKSTPGAGSTFTLRLLAAPATRRGNPTAVLEVYTTNGEVLGISAATPGAALTKEDYGKNLVG